MRDEQMDVLIVGAGPVGLMAGLFLAQAGVSLRVIDQESGTAARSYGCALHSASLKHLQQLGLLDTVLGLGRKVSKVAFYERENRKAELDLAQAGAEFPFMLILPQDEFERMLVEALESRTGKAILWNHRLDDFQTAGDRVRSSVQELTGTSTGYVVPHWETVVKQRFDVHSSYVIGADGHRSLVRQRLGVASMGGTQREVFAAYEFTTDEAPYDEVRVVMDTDSSSVLWPLPGNKCRWAFQLLHSEATEFPDKERRALRVSDETTDQKIRDFVAGLAQKRAPWFKLSVKEVTWFSDVVFEHHCVKEFGAGRCWLAGDAAHQTGPVGVQSMNAGFIEAKALATAFGKGLEVRGGADLLQQFNREHQARWQQLLGLTGGLKPAANTDPWVKARAPRLLADLPAIDASLERLAGQLNLQLA